MKLSKIMTRDYEWILPETFLEDAAYKMRQLDTGFIPIGDGERLQGVITDRDIVVRAVAEGLDISTTPVEDVMTPNVIFCYDDQDVTEAADLMADKQIRRLVVLNRNKRLIGVISLGDICVKCGDNEMAGNILEDVSQTPIPAY